MAMEQTEIDKTFLEQYIGKPLLTDSGEVIILSKVIVNNVEVTRKLGWFKTETVMQDRIVGLVVNQKKYTVASEEHLQAFIRLVVKSRPRFEAMNLSLLKHKLKIVQF